MLIHDDFSQPAMLTPGQYRWVPSPQPGVERVMLDRIGGEVARATSIVRYARGSSFPAHSHPEGEEILILSGGFSEGERHYPAGWYLRNPPGSSHQPSSDEGALLFVKLRQAAAGERAFVRIDTRDPAHWRTQAGRALCPLFEGGGESVRLERVAPGQALAEDAAGGIEILVVSGELQDAQGPLGSGTWLRLPPGQALDRRAGPAGACVYVKTGHLRSASAAPGAA
ncbi:MULTISPECIES: cupin domain-containing protein [Ramlibacter]|uniref:Cupin domain-containing protein n=1 Tax=Ramlibacter aquaticus TaxID=2780094 RepID=A0ABR9S9P4_9BURK|nr:MULTISPECIES: cupin domain-containing protein [Ramlibacter]MBE7939073.1 cupin domain-containing protein [Ramlibacter aquaticus]